MWHFENVIFYYLVNVLLYYQQVLHIMNTVALHCTECIEAHEHVFIHLVWVHYIIIVTYKQNQYCLWQGIWYCLVCKLDIIMKWLAALKSEVTDQTGRKAGIRWEPSSQSGINSPTRPETDRDRVWPKACLAAMAGNSPPFSLSVSLSLNYTFYGPVNQPEAKYQLMCSNTCQY